MFAVWFYPTTIGQRPVRRFRNIPPQHADRTRSPLRMRIQSLCCFIIQSVDGVALFHRDINIPLTNHQTPKEVDNSILNLLHEHRICAGDSKKLYTRTKSETQPRLNTLKKITQHGLMMGEKNFWWIFFSFYMVGFALFYSINFL